MTVTYQLSFEELNADLIHKIKSQFHNRLDSLRVTLEVADMDETDAILNNSELSEKILRRRKSASEGNVLSFTPESFHEIIEKHSI
jgi:uncharacterized membrane protein YgaE (UPF0421/DUF939 family)